MPRVYRWEPPPYGKASSKQICDMEGHRLYVKRVRKGTRRFTAVIDGKDLRWNNETIDDAKRALEAHFNLLYPDYDKLD